MSVFKVSSTAQCQQWLLSRLRC